MAEPIRDADELRNFFRMEPEEKAKAAGAVTLLPLTQRAAADQPAQIVQENLRDGIPMQVNPPEEAFGEGVFGNVSPWVRFQTARRKTIEDQQKYLESKFPGKVRKAKSSDDFIIEMQDPDTGKPRDVILNEEQITLGDVAALAGQAPEIAASLISMAGAGKIRALMAAPKAIQTAGKIIAGAAGFKAGEAAQQIETRMEQGQPVELGKTLAEKASETPAQIALDTATLGVFKAASMANRLRQGGPGMFQTPIQKEGIAAKSELAGKYQRPELPYSAGEVSGAPAIVFLEAYGAAKPQSTAILQGFKDAQQAEVKALGEAMTARTGTDEEVGSQLLTFLKGNEKAKEDALDAIRKTMSQQEIASLQRQLGKVARVPSQFKPSEAGELIRNEFQGLWGNVKNKVRSAYETAYAVPGAQVADIPTDTIAKEVDSLAGRFPTAEATNWLRSYKGTLSPNESYKDIVQRRSDLWERIETAPADRATKDYMFGQLSGAMTATLDDAAKTIKNPQFQKLITRANEAFKKEELPFYQNGLRDVLLKAGHPGSPENIKLLDRFAQSTDLYRRLISVTGAGGKVPETVRTAVIDGLLTKSGKTAIDPQYLDADKFIKNLTDLATAKETREMFTDIFGQRGQALVNQAKVLGAIQGTLSKDEAQQLLMGGAPSMSKGRLKRVLDAQRQADSVEAKRLLSGSLDDLNPEQFVNRFSDRLTESELKSLMRRVEADAPALYGQIQDKQIEQILGKAGTYETWDRSNIEKVINNPKMRAKYEAVLGAKMRDIEMFAKALGPIQAAREMAEGTGMLVKGQSIGALARLFKYDPSNRRSKIGQIFEEIPPWVGWKLTARLLNSGAFREYASKGFPPESANLVRNVLISEPFLMDLASSASSPEVVRDIAMALRDWGKRVSTPAEQATAEEPIKNREELRQFLQQQ